MTLFIKGLIIGIGKILPGVSGTVLAISLNEYKNIIYSFNNIFKKRNLLYLIKIGLGILISMIFMSKVLIYFINNYQTETILLFVGLIMGTIPNIYSKVLNKEFLENVVYTVLINDKVLEKLNNYDLEILEKLYIEKV